VHEALDELETFRELLADLLGARVAHRFLELTLELGKVARLQDRLDRFTAHAGDEVAFAVLVERFAILGFREELAALERGLARIDDDVVLVVDHALELAAAHVEHEADARRHALVEPDVRHGHGQFDVAHALAANAGEGHFDTAAIADDALVLDALVLSAGAFPVTGRTEDTLAEETALLRLEGTVVDRFRILYFTMAPRADRIGSSHGNRHLVEADGTFLAEDFANVRFDYVHIK
jgi:hypothetical protein